jgi:hypothetical protein
MQYHPVIPTYTETNINSAFRAIANGISVRNASLDWGVPRATLHDRKIGHESYQKAAASLQKLSPVQEKHLTDWVLI